MTTSSLGMPDALIGEIVLAEIGTNTAESRTATYGVLIDWNDNGNYSGPYDVVTEDVRHNPGIKIQRGKDSVRPRSPAMVPAGSFALGNVHRRYSAENGASPLTGLIEPDRPVRVDLVNVISTPLITGAIDEPQQQPSRDERSIGINFLGNTAALRGQEISTILYQQIRTDEAVTVVLDAVGWPAADRVIAVGDTVMNFWWLDNDDPWAALAELLETEGTGASMYEDGRGYFHFENRNYRDMAGRSMVSQATFNETAPDSGLAYQRFSYVPGMKEIFNTVRITIKERTLTAALGKAWDAGKPVSLSASESRTVFATGADPWTAVQNVTLTTDYVVLSGSLASVTTAVVSATNVAITFTAGVSGAIVVGPAANPSSGPQLRAQVAAVTAEPEISVTDVGAVVTRAKTLSLTEHIRREISPGYAQSLCNVALAYYKEPRPSIAIEFVNASPPRLAQIGAREVSDRITIVEPQTGVNRDIHVEQLNHEINVGGRDHRCALIGSAALTANAPGLWGDTTNGGWGTAEWTD